MLINIPLNCTETKRHRVCSPLPRCSAYFVIMLQSCRDCCLLVMIFKSQLMINTFGSDSCKRPVLYLHTFSCCSDSDVHCNVEGHGGWKGTVKEEERRCHARNNFFPYVFLVCQVSTQNTLESTSHECLIFLQGLLCCHLVLCKHPKTSCEEIKNVGFMDKGHSVTWGKNGG